MFAKKTKEHQHEHKFSLPKETHDVLVEKFKVLKEPVILEVFIKEGQNDPYNDVTVAFVKELATLSEKITTTINVIGDEKSKQYEVTRSPTVLINPDQYHIRYTGAPVGEEGQSFVEAIRLVSLHESELSKTSKEQLSKLSQKRLVQVFVTLSCPYCPGQVIHAVKAAVERPDLISSECVDAMEHSDLSNQYGVGAVPHTVINNTTMSRGFEPEERFITELVTLKPLDDETSPLQVYTDVVRVDLLIIGAGPAGLTAGIYAARSGLKTMILEKSTVGGQVVITPVVENWPGLRSVAGKQLIEMIHTQVRDYTPILEGEEVREIKVGKNLEAFTNKRLYQAKALILATGASHRKLQVPGETVLYGRGISYCATCDGYFYKGKQVVVVGGGNTALTDALYLKSLGAHVVILDRSDRFTAEKPLQDSVQREQIPIQWNVDVTEIIGDQHVTSIKIKSVKENIVSEMKTDGVFIAIGEDPNVSLAKDIGITLNDSGYVQVDEGGRTNIPRIYAAGDVTGGVRQIVTAVGKGATAAISAFNDISAQSK